MLLGKCLGKNLAFEDLPLTPEQHERMSTTEYTKPIIDGAIAELISARELITNKDLIPEHINLVTLNSLCDKDVH